MQHSQWIGNGKAIALHGARIEFHPAALPVLAPCKNGERLFLRAFCLPRCCQLVVAAGQAKFTSGSAKHPTAALHGAASGWCGQRNGGRSPF